MKRRRPITILVIIVALIAVVASALLSRHSTIVLTGIVSTDEVILSSEIGGRIDRLNVREGDNVSKGQLLAVLHPPEYSADFQAAESTYVQAQAGAVQAAADLKFEEEQSRAQIGQAQAALAAAKAQADAAAADQENAALAFRREGELRKTGTNSLQEFDAARTTADGATARAQAAQHQVAAAQSALQLAEADTQQVAARRAARDAALAQAKAAAAQADKAKARLGYTEIHSPISGTVDVRAARQGEVVTPAQPILTLIDPDDLWVRVDLEESYIDRVLVGDHLQVRLPSGEVRDGVVFYRAVDADFATQRDVSRTKRDIRTFELRLRCDNHDRALAVGMTAYVTVPLNRHRS